VRQYILSGGEVKKFSLSNPWAEALRRAEDSGKHLLPTGVVVIERRLMDACFGGLKVARPKGARRPCADPWLCQGLRPQTF